MIYNYDGTVVLTEHETTALGILVALDRLEDVGDWLDREDVSGLTDTGFVEVSEVVKNQATKLRDALGNFERSCDVDARLVWGEVK
jgi:hypothetical protein